MGHYSGVKMDRLSSGLERDEMEKSAQEVSAITLNSNEEQLIERSSRRLAMPDELFQLNELDVLYDEESSALWTYMRPLVRPSFTPPMLADFERWQALIAPNFGPGKVQLKYLVLGSRAPGVFCFGGDLELFQQFIRSGNRDGLVRYGYRCVEILNRNIHTLDLPMITIGLVQGQALGGGFEALLSFDVIVAERGSSFGLPEVMFGLFPGMGAHAILSRKLGTAMAERLILSNESYSAEQMYDMGIVNVLAEPGEGVAAVRNYMAKAERKHAGLVGTRRAMRAASPIELDEFYRIVEIWADTALRLNEQDLKLMHRLASAQSRLVKAA